MRFFSQFPLTDYRINGENAKTSLIDIYRHVDINETLIDDITNYKFYDIKDGERPDIISYKLYGSPDYHWTFFIINEKINNLNDWPRSYQEQSSYIDRKYDEYSVLEFIPSQEFLSTKFPSEEIPTNITISGINQGSGTYTRIGNDILGAPRWELTQDDGGKSILHIQRFGDPTLASYTWTIQDNTDTLDSPIVEPQHINRVDISNMVEGNGTYMRDVDINDAPSWKFIDENGDENILAIRPLVVGNITYHVWSIYDPVDDDPYHHEAALDGVNTYRTLESSQSIAPWETGFAGWENASGTYDPSNSPIFSVFVSDDGDPFLINTLGYREDVIKQKPWLLTGWSDIGNTSSGSTQPSFSFESKSLIKYNNYFGDIDFTDPNLRIKVKGTDFVAETAAIDSERLQVWVKNISDDSFLSNDEVTYVLDYDTTSQSERTAWLENVILPWVQTNHYDIYDNLINDIRLIDDNILPFLRGSVDTVDDVTYNSGYSIGSYEIDSSVPSDTGIIDGGDYVRGSNDTFANDTILSLLYSDYLSNIEFKTTRSWLKSYNAPYSYMDNNDEFITAYDALTASAENSNYITYFSAEEEENESKKKIRVLSDSDVESFAEYYKELINE